MCVNFTTPLMIAAWEGHQQIVQMLIEAGADVNYKDSEVRWWCTAAMSVVFFYAWRIVQAGGTALIRASWNGHTDIVRVLMEAAADVNAQRQASCSISTVECVRDASSCNFHRSIES